MSLAQQAADMLASDENFRNQFDRNHPDFHGVRALPRGLRLLVLVHALFVVFSAASVPYSPSSSSLLLRRCSALALSRGRCV